MKYKLSILLSFVLSIVSSYASDGWKTDFEASLAEAKSQKKHVLVNFTGSDWCGWCIKLDKEVFSQDAFKEFAAANLVLVEVDFPRKKKQSEELKLQNEALAEKYDVQGFPSIFVFDPDGELLGKTGYVAGGSEDYVKHLQEIIN